MLQTAASGSSSATVSAVVPNFNHGHLLPAAIAGLRSQTRAPNEIIIVDDCSTDGSREVIATLLREDPRLVVLFNDVNRGAIGALNAGIQRASCTHLYLAAADDVAYPSLIESLTDESARNPGLGLYCAEMRVVDTSSGRVSFRPVARPSANATAFTPQDTRHLLSRIDNFIMTGAALLDREKLLACGGLRPDFGSFADGFAVRQLALRYGFGFLPKVLAEWRVGDSGLSRKTAADPPLVLRMLEKMRAACAADPAFPSGYAEQFERRWRFGVLRLAIAHPAAAGPLIDAVAYGPPTARRLLKTLAGLPLLGQPLALAWLTLAFRPFAAGPLVATAFGRRLTRASKHATVPRS